MECPHCGALMKEEQVFCESCGRERLLVPEFDAQMDAQLQSTISGIADDLANTKNIKPALIESELEKQKEQQLQSNIDKETKTEKENTSSGENIKTVDGKSGKRNFSILFVVASMFAVVILITGIVFGFVQYNNNSYDYQIKKAEEMYHLSDYEQMLVYAKKASELAENSSDAKMMIAKAYEGLGKTEYKKQMLESLLKLDPAYVSAYDLLIPMKIEAKEYKQIGELLMLCPEQSVKDKYADYLIEAPQFAQDNGSYDDVTTVSVKLFASGNGVIYYTLNGKDPITEGREYMSPIILEPGDYEIKAVYKNTYGYCSEVVSNTYHVEGSQIEEVFITLESGVYESPQYVDIENVDESKTVYYTMDGSDPDTNSAVFSNPVPLPLGDSHFVFGVYDDDTLIGEFARADYSLKVDVDMTGAQAVNMLIQSLILTGSLMTYDGALPDMEGRKTYDAYTLIEQNDTLYYLISETYISPENSQQKTGDLFAVNVATGESYTAKQNQQGIFDLVKIE